MSQSSRKIKYLSLVYWSVFLLLVQWAGLPNLIQSKSIPCDFPFPLSAAHASAEPSPLKAKWPHDASDLPHDPALTYGTLGNGFRYVLLSNPEPENRVSVHLNVQVGSMHEQDHELGMAHFLEHMVFCGTTHFRPGELVEYFQSIGMQFGPDANGRTGFNETIYDIVLPEGGRDFLDKALLVMADYAGGALLLPEEIDRERKVVLAEMKNRDSASYRTFESKFKYEFSGARISERLPIGKEKTLKKVDRAALKTFYDKWYRPERMVLVMVGDFDKKAATELIKSRFSDFHSRAPKPAEPDFGKIRRKGLSAFYHFDPEAGSTKVGVETIVQGSPEPDSFARQKRLLIEESANRIVQDRLNALVAKSNSLLTSAAIQSGYFLNPVRYAEIAATCAPDKWEKVLRLIEKSLREALVCGFAKDELERVKTEILAELDNAVKNASTRNSSDVAEDIISCLNQDRVFLSPFQDKDLFSPVVRALTVKDLHDAMKDAWRADGKIVYITGSTRIFDEKISPEAKIIRAYEDSLSQAVFPPEEKKPLSFPYLKNPATKGNVLSESTIPDLGIVQIDFENRVRLNLKKTDFNANAVLLQISFGSGKSSEPVDKAGLSELSQDVVNESGVGAMNKEELQKSLAGKQTESAFEVKEDCFLINAKTVSGEVEAAFQLLFAHLTDQAFRKEAFDLAMKRFGQQYDELNHSIEGSMALYGKRFLAGGDSRFGLPPQDAFNRLSLQDIEAWIRPCLKNDPLEVSVVGDFDMDSVILLASRYLGSLPERQRIENAMRRPSPGFPSGKSLALTVDTQIPKALVVVSYPTSDIWDISRTRRLSVLSEVFSERMRIKIREKLGETYSPYAYHHPSRAYKGFGALHALVQTSPASAGQVIVEIKKIADDLAQSGISEEELQLAVRPLVTGIRDLIRENDYWLSTVMSGSKRHPEQLAWSRSIVDGYSSVTREEISVLAGQYLNNQNSAVVTIVSDNAPGGIPLR